MMKKQYFLFLIILLLSGCKASKPVAEKSYDNALLLNKTWVVTVINGKELQYPNDADAAYITFKSNMTVHGFGGCNNYNGKYDIVGDSIAFDKVGATMRLCPEQDIEDALFKALNESSSFKVTKENLKLYGKQKKELINCIYLTE